MNILLLSPKLPPYKTGKTPTHKNLDTILLWHVFVYCHTHTHVYCASVADFIFYTKVGKTHVLSARNWYFCDTKSQKIKK